MTARACSPGRAAAWRLAKWRLVEAPKTAAGGAEISKAGFDARGWYPATVPGTVLTTLVDRGVYPDPAYGLNNMAIPESLARQDYWYRTEFEAPAELDGKRQLITFKGINYRAEVWLNGERIGGDRGRLRPRPVRRHGQAEARRRTRWPCASRRRSIRASRTSNRSRRAQA